MEFPFPLKVAALPFLFLVPFILLRLWRCIFPSKPRRCQAPEPRERWPLIGHHQLLLDPADAAQTLSRLADKYGPAMTLRLGFHRTLVISSAELAKECFTTNDRAFADRPLDTAGYHLGYGYALLGLAPYGPYWRTMRKIVTVNVLSSQQVGLLRHVRVAEADKLVHELYSMCAGNGGRPVKVDMRQRLSDLASNIIGQVIIGKRYAASAELRQLMREWISFLGGLSPSDAFPFLGWLGLDTRVQEMKRVSSQLDLVMEGWLSEHRQNKRSSGGEQDFMDMLIATIGEADNSDTTIKATVWALITGGSDTVFVSLTWTLYFLLTNRHALKKAQAGLDLHVSRDRNVDESDLKNLVYLEAIVKESLRTHTTFPLLVPHRAIEDCHVGGFFVPAGTRLLVNAWKIDRDPLIWPEPTEFKPERFMDRNVDLGGKSFELIPFGSGRRICPGLTFGLSVMQLTLARLIHSFDLELQPDSPLGDPIANGFDVLLTPRLPPSLYSV